MDTLFSVRKKNVCITGAAGGIGLVLTEGFLKHGANVLAITRSSSLPLKESVDKTRLIHSCCDLSKENDVVQFAEKIDTIFTERIDVFIHCAWQCPSSKPYSLKNLHDTFSVGLSAAFVLYKTVAEKMAEQGGGSIISIGSINGSLAFPENPAYTSCKAALRLFTKTVARDFGGKNVRANNICPGYVKTKMTKKSFETPELYAARTNRTMLARWADPEELVGPCLFLASNASSYITGIDLFVDGGWTAKGL